MLNEAQLAERERHVFGAEAFGSGFGSSSSAPDPISLASRSGPQSGAASELHPLRQQDALRLFGDFEQTPLSSHVVPVREETRDRVVISWLFEALPEIEQLPKLAEDLGAPKPSSALLSKVKDIARYCESFGLTEPVFDIRENGAIEIFCREGSKGLLIVVNPTVLQVFGDYSGEMWRARYDLSGFTWESHLRKYIQDLSVR